MKKQKPINLDLTKINFPITAISSILHRISGVIAFIFIGFTLYLLNMSLSSYKGFNQALNIIHNLFFKYIILLFIINIFYHLINGIRHILMDFNFLPETLKVGTYSAQLVFIITIIIAFICGILIW